VQGSEHKEEEEEEEEEEIQGRSSVRDVRTRGTFKFDRVLFLNIPPAMVTPGSKASFWFAL